MRKVLFPHTIAGTVYVVRAHVHQGRPATRFQPAEPVCADVVAVQSRDGRVADLELLADGEGVTLDALVAELESRAMEIAAEREVA